MANQTPHWADKKMTVAQQQLLDADNRLRDISRKRREMFADEEDAAKRDRDKAERAIRRAAALKILKPIKSMVDSGRTVTGTRRERCYINMETFTNVEKPSTDFTITNVHIGRKHFGVHVRYNGSQKQHWVEARLLHNSNHALHDGSEYQLPVTNPRVIRELLEGGEA